MQSSKCRLSDFVEGLRVLRGDTFLIARDLGLETLAQDGGLERLVERIKNICSQEPRKKPRNCSDPMGFAWADARVLRSKHARSVGCESLCNHQGL